MRDIDVAIAQGNERAKLALDMYIYRIIKYIGAYTAVLDGVDIIVFTAEVGETSSLFARPCATICHISVLKSTMRLTRHREARRRLSRLPIPR